jgi:Cys-tRNA(Pro)/Cys-tRNA(Cys) deacylase
MDTSPAFQYLTQRNIPFRIFRHLAPVDSIQQAASERDQTTDQVVRSILFRISQTEFLMILVSGPRQVPWKLIRNRLGTNHVTMASDEEVLAQTGYRVGSVSPFGLPHPIRIWVDSKIANFDEISLGSGIRGTAIILRSQDLIQSLDQPEWIDLDQEINLGSK